MRAILDVIFVALDIYTWIIIASVIFSWLYAFGVINAGNQFVGMIGNFLHQATEPALKKIRQFVPPLGNIDLSPIVLLLGIFFIRQVIIYYIYPNVY